MGGRQTCNEKKGGKRKGGQKKEGNQAWCWCFDCRGGPFASVSFSPICVDNRDEKKKTRDHIEKGTKVGYLIEPKKREVDGKFYLKKRSRQKLCDMTKSMLDGYSDGCPEMDMEGWSPGREDILIDQTCSPIYKKALLSEGRCADSLITLSILLFLCMQVEGKMSCTELDGTIQCSLFKVDGIQEHHDTRLFQDNQLLNCLHSIPMAR